MIIPPIRGIDAHGSGSFGASRGKGRVHNGIDIACMPGSLVLSLSAGRVTKIGYPYSQKDEKEVPLAQREKFRKKKALRYVEVTTGNERYRYFYVAPKVALGDEVRAFDCLGVVSDITAIYPGITPHFHFEIKNEENLFLNPVERFNHTFELLD